MKAREFRSTRCAARALLCSIVYLVLTSHGRSQVSPHLDWVQTFGAQAIHEDQYAAATVADRQGNIYVVTSSNAYGRSSFVTIKYDANGTQQWLSKYSGVGAYNNQPKALAIDSAGNVYVAGVSTPNIITTVKYNENGALLWTARYTPLGEEYPSVNAIAVDRQGHVFVIGYAGRFVVIRYNPDGSESWVRVRNIESSANGIVLDSIGNAFVTGTGTSNLNRRILTVKYSSAGTEDWVSEYSARENCEGTAIALDRSGNVCVAGSVTESSSSSYYVTLKYSALGSLAWVAKHDSGGGRVHRACGIKVDSHNAIIVTGTSGIVIANSDVVTIKYNSDGTLQWESRLANGIHASSIAYLVICDSDDVVVAGRYVNADHSSRVLLQYLNSSGVQQWSSSYWGDGKSG